MKFINIKKIFQKLKKYPWQESFLSLKFVPRVFSKLEKIVVLSLFILLAAAITWQILGSWLSSTKVVPQNGGVFKEGIVGGSKEIDKHIARLINAGLTKYDKDKNIVGDIADKWEIKDGGKVYGFHLRDGFNSEDLANQITAKNIWQDIEIATPDPSNITFTFKQSFSPFLYTSTTPIFPYGPFVITKEEKDQIELGANDTYYAGRPNINKIIIKLYPSDEELLKAAKRKEIDGFGLSEDPGNINQFLKFEMNLPRDMYVFFNLNNKDLKNLDVRKALKENTKLNNELTLRMVTSDNQKNISLASSVIEKWSKNNIKVNLDVRDNVTLQKTIIPKRDYDLLLYGLDYGEDPDPYPFWHSSQVKEDGMNLANFKNTKADKLLEQARQEFDFAKRQEDYNQFYQILDSEVPAFVVEHQNYYYFTKENIYGIEFIVGSNESDRFLYVADWYKETKRIKK